MIVALEVTNHEEAVHQTSRIQILSAGVIVP